MLPSSVAVGIPGVDLAPGDHVCVFYPGLAERNEILIPYLRAGLQAGDKCVCVVDADEPDDVVSALGP
ncbi:MAG: eukaryotic-like serine/threonine-protein kinase, partial [Pseudonocardiales bacterium]|nr:eukaryotic-like serine/threonine-protein kinase [Pseudonocardiales bacterium]